MTRYTILTKVAKAQMADSPSRKISDEHGEHATDSSKIEVSDPSQRSQQTV